MLSKSFRISRQDWERLHSLALTDGVSLNTLTLRALSKLFEERGLPGITVD
jgi:predicted HicB family RNase H-like nuclease